jgi:hypothetical protein
MQDIIPPRRRKSIRDIPIPDGKAKVPDMDFERPRPVSIHRDEPIKIHKTYESPIEEEFEEEEEEVQEDRRSPRRFRKEGGSKKKLISTILVVSVLIISAIFFSRSGAKVFVYAKELSQSSNTSINLPFTEEELVLERTVSIKATGEEDVKEKATGKITIYNEYEETEQRLLKNTRFESPSGMIYRIPTSVVVPGSKRDDKGNVVAGKLEVEIVADQIGEEYNTGPTRFTVPGFKDLPQFESFYAKSENAIEGGFDGIRKVISDSDRQESETLLKNQLKEALLTEIKTRTNEQKIVLADESMIVFEMLSDKVSGDNVSISARGTIRATSFDSQNFSNEIAKSVISQFSTAENVVIENLVDLTISVSKKEDDNAVIEISGNIDFVWKNDHESLKQAIAGTNKDSLNETVEMFPGITKVTSEVRPMWKSTFPEDVSKIEIIDSEN